MQRGDRRTSRSAASGRSLAVALLAVIVAVASGGGLVAPGGLAGAAESSVSDSIEDPESGILLDFTVNGGAISEADLDGWEYSIEGTARPGETISIAASGHGTTWTGRHHVNEDLEASLDIWFEDSDVREHETIPPGGSGSLGASYIVPDDISTVEGVAIISNAWINPYGGGSQSLIVRISLDVVEPEETTASTTTEPPPDTQPEKEEESDCDYPDSYYEPADLSRAVVRFGDLHGEVNVRPDCADDDAYIFAELSTPLHHDDRIKTLPRSGAILSWSDMSTFVMREDSIIILDIAYERESKIGHVAGNIWVNLQRMVKDGSMEVEMSQAVAGIKGTTFVAEETGTTSTVKVFEGTVEMRPHRGEPVMVGPGEMVEVTSGGAGAVMAFDVDVELARWDEATQRMTEEAVGDRDGGPSVLLLGAVVIGAAAALLALRSRRRRPHERTEF